MNKTWKCTIFHRYQTGSHSLMSHWWRQWKRRRDFVARQVRIPNRLTERFMTDWSKITACLGWFYAADVNFNTDNDSHISSSWIKHESALFVIDSKPVLTRWSHTGDVNVNAVVTLLLGNCGYQTNRKKDLWQDQNRTLLTILASDKIIYLLLRGASHLASLEIIHEACWCRTDYVLSSKKHEWYWLFYLHMWT